MLSYFKQIGKESVIYGFAGVVAKFFSVFLVPIYTRLFSPAEYGIIGLVSTTISLIQILVVLALDNSSARWFYDTELTIQRKQTIASWFWCQITMAVLLGAGIVIISNEIARLIIGDAGAGIYFRLSGFALPLLSFTPVMINWLRYQRRATTTVVFTIATSSITILFTIIFVVVLRRGLEGIYQAQLISAGINAFIALAILRDWINPKHFRWPLLKEMLVYALPLIPASLAFWVVNLSSRYFVQFYNSTADVGLFQLGANVAMLTAMFTNAFQQAWGPFALSIYKRPEARQVYARIFLVYTALTVTLCLMITVFSPEIIRIFAPASYSGASVVVGALSLSYVVIGFGYFANTGPSIAKNMRPFGTATLISAALYLGLSFALVPRLGMFGVGLSTLLSQSFVSIYVFFRAQQLYPIPYRFGAASGFLIYAVVLLAASSIIHVDNFWLSILVKLLYCSLIIPGLFLFRVVTIEQVQGVRALIQKLNSKTNCSV